MADDVVLRGVPKVKWTFDERQNGRWTLEPGRVELVTRNGRRLDAEAMIAHGHPRDPMTRDERLAMVAGRRVLSGRYLIERDAVDRFWSAFDDLRAAAPDTAAMGSGPWAPYSFCDSTSDHRTGATSR